MDLSRRVHGIKHEIWRIGERKNVNGLNMYESFEKKNKIELATTCL